jgi:hypothetical protein
MREERLTLDIGAALYGMLVEKLRCSGGSRRCRGSEAAVSAQHAAKQQQGNMRNSRQRPTNPQTSSVAPYGRPWRQWQP